jgi:hypothetical protein
MQWQRGLLAAVFFGALLLGVTTGQADNAPAQKDKGDGYVSLFDGKSLKGWHISAQSGHSNKSKNKTGGRWVVEDGAIVGSQDEATKIKEDKYPEFPLPVSPEKWPEFWKHGQWNELKARIEGNPPKITTWIKGVKFMEYTDTMKRLPDKGGIGLQVHGGGDYTKQFVRYRNLKVKTLD